MSAAVTSGSRVSVLLTVFNAQPYLQQAIDSVLSQTYADLELIVIDDCSTDDGWSVIAEAAARDRRVTALRNERQGGASVGLNRGLSIATGGFITRQDADDVSLPTRLADQLALLAMHPEVGAVGSAVGLIDERGQQYATWQVPETDDAIQRALLKSMCLCGPTVMVRREVLERLAFTFDESLSGSEDYDFCLRVAEVTQLANLAQPVYQYRQHRASVSQSREPEQLARKAVALEHAIRRRFGIPPADVLQTVSRDFVTAAVMAHMNASSGHPDEWMGRALRLDPSVLDDAGWLAKVIRSSASVLPTSLQLARIDSLFQTLLPRGRSSWTLHRRLKAEVHMKEVFEAGDVADRVRVRGHLWSAIRSNPLWVANRGVLSLLMRNVLDRRPEGSRSGR